jgi:hypothetical protein
MGTEPCAHEKCTHENHYASMTTKKVQSVRLQGYGLKEGGPQGKNVYLE